MTYRKIKGYQLNGKYKDGEEPQFNKMGTSIVFRMGNKGSLATALSFLKSIGEKTQKISKNNFS